MWQEDQPNVGWLQGGAARPVVGNERETGGAGYLEKDIPTISTGQAWNGVAFGGNEMPPSTITSGHVRG